MPDVFDAKKRSDVMSRIRGQGNKTTELALASAFRRAGIKGWRRHLVIKLALGPRVAKRKGKADLLVRPDFVFRREKVAVFVDGCFWHRCPAHCKMPANNREFWEQKLSRNLERDRFVDRELRKAGWRVWRVWEHALKG
ncbi:MAG: very short patch repair endonuclease [Gammaproteobacteria bacterium]